MIYLILLTSFKYLIGLYLYLLFQLLIKIISRSQIRPDLFLNSLFIIILSNKIQNLKKKNEKISNENK